MNKISIIGLGWLGLPLAKNLQEKGYEVIGSTTTGEKVKKLEAEGITSVQFSLEPYPKGLGFQKLFEAEILVITIPPRSPIWAIRGTVSRRTQIFKKHATKYFCQKTCICEQHRNISREKSGRKIYRRI